ncbi:MAG: endonuclease/exonuclease/phosphatase family protein [Bacteroidales bacterium]|nr:endonuclease/exonuclease/phosphatase family protein [Bacteroidales bacterium]
MTTQSNKQDLAALPYWRRAAKVIFWVFKKTWYTTISALTLLDVLLLLVSAYNDMISPTVWILAPFLGLMFGIILLLSFLWLAFLMLTRRWVLSVLVVLVLLICSNRIWRYCPIHFSDPAPLTNEMTVGGKVTTTPVDSFRIMTFNTHALGRVKLWNIKAEIPIIDMVRECGADVVCLQEYNFNLEKAHTEQEIRNRLLKEYPYYHFLVYSGRKKKDMGLAIYSKWPIVRSEKVDSSEDDYCWALYSELKVRGRRVGVLTCHLNSNSISLKNRKLFHDQLSHFNTDSLGEMKQGFRQLAPSFRLRTKQVATINRYLQNLNKKHEGKLPLIVCGDLNDTPVSFAYRTIRGDMADTWQEAGTGLGITYRDAPFWFRIDHIFHSKHFRTLQVRLMREMKESDHYPVMATFQLLPEEDDGN